MLPADERSWERLAPFDQIIEREFDWSDGERHLRSVLINDRLYGDFELDVSLPEDRVLIDLIYSEPIQRLGLIQQLILPREFATRPETADFTRLEHSIGCMLLTRKLGGNTKQQMHALLHDTAHTAFSHLGDWLKQGMDGADDHHELTQLEYLRSWGIDELLAEYGYDLEEILDPEVHDFVERPRPDLCVDRVDYALREFARWTAPEDVMWLIDELTVVDEMICFKSQMAARVFAERFHDLFYWHWAHDEHALKENLFFKAVQQGIAIGVISEDDMYSADPAVLVKLDLWGDDAIHELLYLAGQQDLEFSSHKHYFRQNIEEETDRLTELQKNDPEHIYVPQRPFNMRWVDPSFVDGDGKRLPLTWIDGDYRARLNRLREMAQYEFKSRIEEKFGGVLLHFQQVKVDPEAKRILSGISEIQ